MIRSILFSSIVSISLIYLMLTSPSSIDKVCTEAEAAMQSVIVRAQKKGEQPDVRVQEDVLGDTKPLLVQINGSKAQQDDLSSLQRERRSMILSDHDKSPSPAGKDSVPAVLLENGDSVSVASLAALREQMEGIYFQNTVGQ